MGAVDEKPKSPGSPPPSPSSETWAFVTELAGGLVHEIKNPLSTIKLNLQLMREDVQEGESTQSRRLVKRLEVLEREVERLNALLESYLQFARLGEMGFRPLSLNRLLTELLEFLQPEFRRQRIEVLQYYDPELPPAPIDGERLKQAILNILINARQAMPEGGQLLVRTLHDDDGVGLEITDTGHGIPADKLSRIFDPFFSTKKNGSGLGLPTTRRIIDMHGGSIEVKSEEGKGTLVRVRLPAARRPEQGPGPQRQTGEVER